MLAMSLAAIEATAVAAAVPTAIGDLGGMSHYSWVFSAYLLTSTTTVPLFGKLADLFGRRRIFHVAVGLFLLGSALSGAASSTTQLILFRAIQGLGAGGVQPISFTIIGDIFTLEERGRIQGLFSGVWGLTSLLGPPLGGLITDALSWRWIFYLNLPLGLASSLILHHFLAERSDREVVLAGVPARPPRRLDIAGTVLLTASISLLLFTLLEGGGAWGFGSRRVLLLFGAVACGLVLFLWQERRAADPMLPLDLFYNPALAPTGVRTDRLIAVCSLGNLVIGVLLFTITAFVPMFIQGVLGGTAVAAGAALTPMLLGWPMASVISGRVVLRAGYRRLAILGGLLLLPGGLLLVRAAYAVSRTELMAATFVIGAGMGFLAMPALLAVQNAVPWQRRGVATSTVQFFRTIGGSIAVAALGALLNARVAAIAGSGIDPNSALRPELRSHLSPAALAALTGGLRSGLQAVFVGMAAIAGSALLVGLAFPRGRPESFAATPHETAPPQPIAADTPLADEAVVRTAFEPTSHQPSWRPR